MISDMDFILRFSKKYNFECVQNPVGIYRQHENQLQNKNLINQANQMQEWYKKIKLSEEFGNEEKLKNIHLRCKFFEIIKNINEKNYLESFKKIIFYPNNLYKVKLFLILVFSKKLINKFINLT